MRLMYKKLATSLLACLYVTTSNAAPLQGLTATPTFQQRPLITPEHVQAIYRNLVETHWVPETGLFLSFPGTMDHKLQQQSSTYEQAAVGLLAVHLGDRERAQGLFHFFRSAWLEGPLKGGREGISGLANFYN